MARIIGRRSNLGKQMESVSEKLSEGNIGCYGNVYPLTGFCIAVSAS